MAVGGPVALGRVPKRIDPRRGVAGPRGFGPRLASLAPVEGQAKRVRFQQTMSPRAGRHHPPGAAMTKIEWSDAPYEANTTARYTGPFRS